MTSIQATGLFGIALSLAAASACGGAAPKARDAAGRPVFDSDLVRHPANEPYFCFSQVTAGDEVSQCEVIKDWCVSELGKAKDMGNPILSGCHEVEEVYCYVAYATGGMINSAKSMCWETPQYCEQMNTRSQTQMGEANVSTCSSLDRTFQPEG